MLRKRLPKKGREEGQKGRQESYAEEVREEKGRETDYEEKEELETLNRLSSYCNYAVSTGCSVGRHMLWNAKFKPEGFCAVRPTEFFGKFAPYNPGAQKSHSIPHLHGWSWRIPQSG
jgi:hypothetical protein